MEEEQCPQKRGDERSLNLWSGLVALGVLGAFGVFGLHLVGEHVAVSLKQPAPPVHFAVPALTLGALIVPLTYGVLGRQRYGEGWRFFQPLKGGLRFVVLQALGWSFFALSLILPCLPWLATALYPGFMLRGIMACAGAAAVLSEVMIVTSLLTFERPGQDDGSAGSAVVAKVMAGGLGTGALRAFTGSASGTAWWGSFIGMQVALALLGCGLAVVSELWANEAWGRSALISSFALVCVAVSVCMTHGMGGRWRFFHDQWRFAGPQGGSWIFVLLQILGWTFFCLAMVIFLAQILRLEDAPSAVMGGIAGLLSEALVASSLLVFRTEVTCGHNGSRAGAGSAAGGVGPFRAAARVVLVTVIYNTQNLVFFSVCASAMLAPLLPRLSLIGWLLGWALYPLTFVGAPHTRGTRLEKAFRGHWLFGEMAAYFDLRIHQQSNRALEPTEAGRRYIFGYHPHGVVPLTIGWACLSPAWTQLFPGVHPSALASSILHLIPLTRDLNQKFGGYAVTKTGFLEALRQQGSVIFIPGGQFEMIHTSSASRVVRLHSAHMGFVRVALQTGSDLVPVFSFGEQVILDNAPFPQKLQVMAMKRMRANIFFVPYGQCFLPIPRPARLRIAVGDPIRVPCVPDAPEELVRQLHARYFTALEDMVAEMRDRCDNPDMEVCVQPPLPRVSAEEWDSACAGLRMEGKVLDRDPMPEMKLRHANWTDEMVWAAAFFVLVFAIVVYQAAAALRFGGYPILQV